jgi:hypothetical protein
MRKAHGHKTADPIYGALVFSAHSADYHDESCSGRLQREMDFPVGGSTTGAVRISAVRHNDTREQGKTG